MATESPNECYAIEFDVLIPAYLKIFNDPFAETLRQYLEDGAKADNTTENEFFINMLKKAINRNIMGLRRPRWKKKCDKANFAIGRI